MNNIVKKYIKEVLFTQEQIESKIKELASWVDETYDEKSDLVIVGILKGSVPFLAQLMKSVKTIHALDFMTISSYAGGFETTNNIKIVMDLSSSIEDKDVLIVEDIVDSGLSMKELLRILKTRKPKSLKTLTLLDKPIGRKVDLNVDKFGFEVPNKFLIGYGMDVKEKFRNIPLIGVFDKSMIDKI